MAPSTSIRRPLPTANRLLGALPPADMEGLRPHLEVAHLPLGLAVYESGSRLRHVYFPTTAIVSLLYVLADGASTELGVVGNDGVVGVSLFMGGDTTPSRAVVQSAGDGKRETERLFPANAT